MMKFKCRITGKHLLSVSFEMKGKVIEAQRQSIHSAARQESGQSLAVEDHRSSIAQSVTSLLG